MGTRRVGSPTRAGGEGVTASCSGCPVGMGQNCSLLQVFPSTVALRRIVISSVMKLPAEMSHLCGPLNKRWARRGMGEK